MIRRRIGSAAWMLATLALLAAQARPGSGAEPAGGSASFGKEQLEALVAPIALYPDALVAQVLMASTYPLEVVEATRWVKANPKLTGDALEQALQAKTWDASVKSLTAFPQVLEMMNEKLEWTQQLGDAFLAQEADVMSAIQRLRVRAKEEGNLESTEQQQVIVKEVPAGDSPQTIIIESAEPQVVYVPTYKPTVVYGSWPYPSYPPYSYYPPGYAAMTGLISFGVGMAVGSALWGDCDWGGGDVDIDVNRYNEFNRTNIRDSSWKHDPEHRRGVGYRDEGTRERYGKRDDAGARSREAFRGRAEAGQREMAGGGAERMRQDYASRGGDAGRRDGGGRAGQGGFDGNRGGAGQVGQRGGAGAVGRDGGGDRGGAFSGMGTSGSQVRQQSQRGQASRQSAMRAGGGRSGGTSRGGGGGGRGGGGRGGRR